MKQLYVCVKYFVTCKTKLNKMTKLKIYEFSRKIDKIIFFKTTKVICHVNGKFSNIIRQDIKNKNK